MNTQAIIADIRANLTDYSDADFKTLMGRLTLNAYGAEVSDALADEVIAERKRRAYVAHKEAQEAEAAEWLETNAAELYESQDRDDRMMVYGSEYFAQTEQDILDIDVADDDIDSLSSAEAHGIYYVDDIVAHRPNTKLVETVPTAKEADVLSPFYTPATNHIAIEGFDTMTPAAPRVEGLPCYAYAAPKRWTADKAQQLARRIDRVAKERAVFGIADIIGTATGAAKVSRAAQYADKQSKAQRAAKRNAKLARRLASKL